MCSKMGDKQGVCRRGCNRGNGGTAASVSYQGLGFRSRGLGSNGGRAETALPWSSQLIHRTIHKPGFLAAGSFATQCFGEHNRPAAPSSAILMGLRHALVCMHAYARPKAVWHPHLL